MDEVDELQNMENVCRLCLSTDEPKLSVFGEQESPVSLANKIQACLSIQVGISHCCEHLLASECFLLSLYFYACRIDLLVRNTTV